LADTGKVVLPLENHEPSQTDEFVSGVSMRVVKAMRGASELQYKLGHRRNIVPFIDLSPVTVAGRAFVASAWPRNVACICDCE